MMQENKAGCTKSDRIQNERHRPADGCGRRYLPTFLHGVADKPISRRSPRTGEICLVERATGKLLCHSVLGGLPSREPGRVSSLVILQFEIGRDRRISWPPVGPHPPGSKILIFPPGCSFRFPSFCFSGTARGRTVSSEMLRPDAIRRSMRRRKHKAAGRLHTTKAVFVVPR
jgi:hypothetical protein